jgi:hypothetical protein
VTRGLSFACLLLLGCELEPRAALDLDRIEEPTEDCVAVIHESLEPGLALHEYVADAPNSPGGWALATILDEALNQPELALVRIPATPDEASTEPIELGVAELSAVAIELRAGVLPGELWVLLEKPSEASLRKLAPEVGTIAGNGSIDNFPTTDGGEDCSNEFHRQLLLIGGRPHVLALPRCSDSTALELQLLELDPDSLEFTSAWVLTFDPCVNDPACQLQFPYTLDPIRGGESTPTATAEQVAVGFTQVRDFGNGLTSTDVSLLELELQANGPHARIIRFENVWLTPTELGFADLGQDTYSIQLLVRNGGSEVDAALLRFDRVGELFVQIKYPQLPFGGRGQLIQLATRSAMVDIDVDQGTLHAIPLVDAASWPVWEPRTLLELDDLVGFEPAGVGQLLLRREQAPPQIVHVRCLSDPED